MTNTELAALRKELELSQSKAARKLGVAEATFRKWENGRMQPIPDWVANELKRKSHV